MLARGAVVWLSLVACGRTVAPNDGGDVDGPSAVDTNPDAGPAMPLDVAGGAADADAQPADRALPPDEGPRAFEVLARLAAVQPPTYLPIPSEHRFTLWLDFANGRAVAGSGGTASEGPLVRAGEHRWTIGPLSGLGVAGAEQGCVGWGTVDYDVLQLDLAGTEATGTGSGTTNTYAIDVGHRFAITASFTASLDHEPPRISLLARAGVMPPQVYPYLAASEPLPPGTTVTVEIGGARHSLTPSPPRTSGGIGSFGLYERPPPLAWERDYTFVFEPALVDLAGNRAPSNTVVLSTPRAPAFLAEDGFEGPLVATLAGSAKVVEGDTLLAIGGARSIVIPPVRNDRAGPLARFTAKLRVATGQQRLRARVRLLGVSEVPTPPVFALFNRLHVGVGVPGEATWVEATLPTNKGVWSNERQYAIGPPADIVVPLPAGASEVLFDASQSIEDCHWGTDGLVIDDVKLE